MLTRKRHNVTLYLLCLYCLILISNKSRWIKYKFWMIPNVIENRQNLRNCITTLHSLNRRTDQRGVMALLLYASIRMSLGLNLGRTAGYPNWCSSRKTARNCCIIHPAKLTSHIHPAIYVVYNLRRDPSHTNEGINNGNDT